MLARFSGIAEPLHARLTALGDVGVEGELRRLGQYLAAPWWRYEPERRMNGPFRGGSVPLS